MTNTQISFLITIISGLATTIGIIPIFINNINEDKIISYSLSFSSGVMISLSLFDLIPESLKYLTYNKYIYTILTSFIFIILGIIISLITDNKNNNNNNLYNIGIISMIAIIIHNIPEGIITFITSNINIKLGLSLGLSILIHNIPEGICIAVPIYYATNKKLKALKYTLLSGLSEPLGALITHLFLINYINNYILGILLSITSGIMLKISILNLIPESLTYQKNISNILFFILGILIIIFKNII